MLHNKNEKKKPDENSSSFVNNLLNDMLIYKDSI